MNGEVEIDEKCIIGDPEIMELNEKYPELADLEQYIIDNEYKISE